MDYDANAGYRTAMETRTRGSQERWIIEHNQAEEGEGRVEPSQGMVAREEKE
jgi:hypothetical protein